MTIGTGVTKIGAKAFKSCKKLGTVKISSPKLKSVGKQAFKGTKTDIKVTVPAKKQTAYKKLLKNSGISIKCTLCQGHYDFSFSDFYFIFVCCVEASK